MNRATFDDLFRLAQSGDSNAIEELSAPLLVRLRVLAKHTAWWLNSQEVDDVVQDTMFTFLEKIQQVNENPVGFVVQILRFKIGNELKLRRSRSTSPLSAVQLNQNENARGEFPLSVDAFGMSPARADHGLESKEELAAVLQKIGELKLFCKSLFRTLLEGKSINEFWHSTCANEPDLTRSAFDKRIFDCRKSLRDRLGKLC